MDDCYFNDDTKLRIEEMSKRNLENHDFIKYSLYRHLEKPGYNNKYPGFSIYIKIYQENSRTSSTT